MTTTVTIDVYYVCTARRYISDKVTWNIYNIHYPYNQMTWLLLVRDEKCHCQRQCQYWWLCRSTSMSLSMPVPILVQGCLWCCQCGK